MNLDSQSKEVLIKDLLMDANLVLQAYLNSLVSTEKAAVAAAMSIGAEAEVRCRLRPNGLPGISIWLFPQNGTDGINIVAANLD